MNGSGLATILYGPERTAADIERVRELLRMFDCPRTEFEHRPHFIVSDDMALRVASELGRSDRLDADTDPASWPDDELAACVSAYLDMLASDLAGEKIVKKQVYESLAASSISGRPAKSVEWLFQNISHIMVSMGLPHVNGLLPAPNVGKKNEPRLRKLIETSDTSFAQISEPTADPVELERRVARLRKKTVFKPSGRKAPKKKPSTSTAFERDPEVVAYVLQEAAGICEGCGEQGPFLKKGEPFLEVHHVRPLADGGSDTVENAAAVCPNCHRECHHSDDANARTEAIYARTKRLVRE